MPTTSRSDPYYFQVKPVPASRPRVSKWGTYYGKQYTAFRKTMESLVINYTGLMYEGPLAVTLHLYLPWPKTATKRKWPRGDVDNYAKAVLDSLTGVFWEDDDQIVELSVTKEFCESSGCFSIRVERMDE